MTPWSSQVDHNMSHSSLPLAPQLQTKKIMDKLTEWQAAAGQMKPYFPVGDELLAFWYRELQSFKNELPLLHKLAHDALKVHPLSLHELILTFDTPFHISTFDTDIAAT